VNKVVLNVLGAKRYDFNGISGTKVFAQQESDSFNNQDVIGIEVIECSAPLSVFDDLKNLDFPVEVMAEVRFTRGAGGKAGLRVLSAVSLAPVVPTKAGASQPSKPADASKKD